MPLTPEFEAEQITGDIQDIKEPQELKFKVGEDMASQKLYILKINVGTQL